MGFQTNFGFFGFFGVEPPPILEYHEELNFIISWKCIWVDCRGHTMTCLEQKVTVSATAQVTEAWPEAYSVFRVHAKSHEQLSRGTATPSNSCA